jgi:hypothetical protein
MKKTGFKVCFSRFFNLYRYNTSAARSGVSAADATTAVTLPPSPPPSPPPPGATPAGGVGSSSSSSSSGGIANGVPADSELTFIIGGGLVGGVLLLMALAYYFLEYRLDDDKKPLHLRKAGNDRSISGPSGGLRVGDFLPDIKGNRVVPVFAYPPVAPKPPYSRLLLVSSRMMTPELLVAAAKKPEVGVILFDWNAFDLEDLMAACKQATGGGLLVNKLDSVGLMTHGKPGNVNVVKGRRTNMTNLDKFPDLVGLYKSSPVYP